MDWEKENERIENLPYSLPSKLTALLDIYKKAIHKKNTSVVIIIDGRSGMGKTTLACQIAKYMDSDFDLHKLHYKPVAFLEGDAKYKKIGLSKGSPGDAFLFDEAMIINSRSALTEINKMVVSAMSMIRSRRLFIIFCVNSIFDLDRNLALSRADLLLHVYGHSLVDRGKFLAFFTGEDGINRIKRLFLVGKKYYSYTEPRSNFYSRFGSYFTVDQKIYDQQKDENVKDFLENTSKKKGLGKTEQSRDLLVLYLAKVLGIKQKQIAEIAKLSEESISVIMSRHRTLNT